MFNVLEIFFAFLRAFIKVLMRQESCVNLLVAIFFGKRMIIYMGKEEVEVNGTLISWLRVT